MNGAWWKTLLAAGPIGAVTAFLLLQSAGMVPSTAAEIKQSVQAHQAQADQQLQVLQQIARQQAEQARLLRLSCLRVAQSEADRRACLGE